MELHHLPRLMAILDAHAPSLPPGATDQPGSRADAVCAGCGRLYTWHALRPDAEGARLLCAPCHAAITRPPTGARLLRILRQPMFWLGLTLLVAILLHGIGAGKTDPEAYAASDADRPWHQRRGALIYLQQAERIQMRLVTLDALGAPPAERSRWAALQQETLSKLLGVWKDAPVREDLIIGQSVTSTYAGDLDKAYLYIYSISDQMEALDARDPRRLTYLTHRGILRLESAAVHSRPEYRQRGIDDLETVLKTLAGIDADMSSDQAITDLLEVYSGNKSKDEAAITERLRLICQSQLEHADLFRSILAAFDRHQVHSEVAQDMRRHYQVKTPDFLSAPSTAPGLDIRGFGD